MAPKTDFLFKLSPYLFTLAVFSLYCLVLGDLQRTAIGLQGPGEHYGLMLVLDESGYVSIADNLSRGQGYQIGWPDSQPTAWRPPLYPLLLAGIFAAFGPQASLGLVLNGVLLVGSLYVVGLAARLVSKLTQAPVSPLMAQWALALVPSNYFFASLVQTEALALFLGAAILSALLALDLYCKGKEPVIRGIFRRSLFLGVTCGLASLARPELMIVIGFVAIYQLLSLGFYNRTAWLNALVIGIGAGIFLAIWIAYNVDHLNTFVPSTTMGGTVFFGAHNDDTWSRSPGSWGNPPRILGHERYASLMEMGEVKMDRELYRLGFSWLEQQPISRILQLEVYKLGRLWIPYEFATTEKLGRLPSTLISILFLPFWGFAILGLRKLLQLKQMSVLAILLLFPTANTVAVLLTYGTARYRITSYPTLSVLAAIGVMTIIMRNKHVRREQDKPFN